jgi:signal transduction histidine kinase
MISFDRDEDRLVIVQNHQSEEKLREELANLRSEVRRLRASEKKLKDMKEAMQKKTHALGERVKELRCLYAMSSLVEKHGSSLDKILSGIVEVIPPAWQYPEITCARIEVGEEVFVSERFRETRWRQSSNIVVKDKKVGSLDVFYLEKRPECGEGPFLKEERSLINSLAEHIGEIVERKLAEDALKETMTRNKALLNAIPDLIFRVHKDGTILDFKKGSTLGRDLNSRKIIGMKVAKLPEHYQFIPQELVRQGMKNGINVLRTGKTQIFEHRITRGSTVFYFEVLLTVSGEDEVLGIMRDITERRRLENQVLEISEWEQQRIGQDLHDSLSQQLAGIAYLGKVLEQRLSAKSMEEANDAAEIISLIDDAITQTKGLARGLYPIRMEEIGLMNALGELAHTVEKLFTVSCRFEYDRPVLIHDTINAIHLYRIAQEAVNNAIKHGKAIDILISFTSGNGVTNLAIKDNGTGFRKVQKDEKGMGISTMKYRANMVGASIDIRSDRNGTVVSCSFQTKQDEKGRRKM